MNAPAISGGNATIFVSDMDRSVRFYTEVLGLKLAFRAGNEWASIDAGGFQIGLHPATPHAPRPGARGSIEVGLMVPPPMQAAFDAYAARGVRFDGPPKFDGAVTLAPFGDPDGNALYLVCMGG
jgi:catechol 2,3-dioxygenase-like lactoylglutathione lyase family enzyme